MFRFSFWLCLFFMELVSGCASPPLQKPKKWVPYDFSKSGEPPAFIMAFEDIDTACSDRPDPKQCRELWKALPSQALPIGASEITYLTNLGKGLERVRMSKESHCAIMLEPGDKTSCHQYWWYFVRKKLLEDI